MTAIAPRRTTSDATDGIDSVEAPAIGRRSHLRKIIGDLAEGIVIVERDGEIAWANEAALAMHGVAAIGDLGGDLAGYASRFALIYRNRHALDEAEYPIARALTGETMRDVVVSVAHRGDAPKWTHRVRTLVLDDAGTDPGFVAVVIVDATEEYNAELRFEKAFGANPAPAIICRVQDRRFVKVNQGFLEMTGHHRDDLLGATVDDVDVLEEADRRHEAIDRLLAGRTIPQMEARLTLPNGGTKAVIVAGQPIEIADESCMLFTFIDLEHRKKAETALARSEERFAKAFQLAPVPMLVTALKDARILHANDAFVAEFGHGRATAIGKSKAELDLWSDPESRHSVERLLREHGRVQSIAVPLKARNGRRVACLLSAEAVSILDEDCVLIVMQNVEDRRQSETEILAAVESALQDTSWLGRKIVERLNKAVDVAASPCPSEALSAREKEVLGLLASGSSDVDIAARLKIARNTVRNHVRAIYTAIGVHQRGEAIVWARRRGFGDK